jgi:YidC/Oxa1 family membrane protein insertase
MQSKDPDQQRNLLLAVVLSMAVLLGWQLFYAGPKMKEEQARQRAVTEQQQTVSPSQPATGDGAATAPSAGGTVPGAAPAVTMTREDAIKATSRVAIDTPSLQGSINLKSGRIDDLKLIRYHETVDPKSPYVTLFSPANSPFPYFAEHGWVPAAGQSVKVPDRDTEWTVASQDPLTPSTPVTLTWDNGEGVLFRRTVSIDNDYMLSFVDEVENKSAASVSIVPYARVHRYGTQKLQGFWILHEGLIGVIGEQGEQRTTYANAPDEGTQSFEPAKGGWLGLTDKYWAATVIPDQQQSYIGSFSAEEAAGPAGKPSFQADYTLAQPITIPAGQSKTVESMLFAGAKEVKLLQQYQSELGVKQLDLLIDWGWFFFITKPLYYLMEAINSVVNNFGVTIIILTVFVRLAFFPLANKQFASMAKMKKLQPEMEKLRERYKDDKVKQQQELMELYKKEKVNPIAGCLPILLQLPVFFALYKVLFVTIDMRHAPFFGWIQDLSAPDPTSLFNLFGLLPFAVPEFLHVGVWPLIMGITMWLQMQLNPQQPDPVQQKIFAWMPVVFTFLLASFPAGLVIYWAWSNTLSLAQQYYIMRKHGAEIHLMGNLSRQLKSIKDAPEQIAALVTGRGGDKTKPDNDNKPGKSKGEGDSGKGE